jgi:hypothetical protein
METAELWKLIDSKIQSTKEQTDFILDADTAELDIVHPNDLIDNKKLKVAACKIVRKRLTEIYALIEKIEEQEKVDIVNLEVLIDESML